MIHRAALSAILLFSIWSVLTFLCRYQTSTDVDLGIAVSRLNLRDQALWSLPLAIFIWLGSMFLFELFRRLLVLPRFAKRVTTHPRLPAP